MKTQKPQQGFTLLELLIVVAIIAILVSIAFPAYQRYVVKSKFSEVIFASMPYKLGVELCFQREGSLISSSCTNGQESIPATTAANSGYLKLGSGVISANAALTASITMIGEKSALGTASDLTYVLKGTAGGIGYPIIWENVGGSCLSLGYC